MEYSTELNRDQLSGGSKEWRVNQLAFFLEE